MTKSYIQNKLDSMGFPEELVKVNVIKENQMPIEIELIFIQEALGEKFSSMIKSISFDKDVPDYKVSLVKGIPTKATILPDTEEIKFAYDYTTWIDVNYERKPNEEGLVLTHKEEIENQKKVIAWLIKKIGQSALNGQSIMNISLPVNIFDKRTMLQVFVYELAESPFIFNKVYYTKDPIEKLKYMTTFLIAQHYLSAMLLKPFNPIIGETYQAKIGNLNCYAEQTVHKPPTCNIYCFDDDKLFEIVGYIETTAETGPNYCKAKKLGRLMVFFKDGFRYRIYYPNIHVTGTTLGKKTFNLKHRALVIDEKNKLACFIRYNPERKGFVKGLFSKKTEDFPDKFIGKICPLEDIKIDPKGPKHEVKDGKGISELSGNWTKECVFDGKIYWKRNNENLCKYYEMKNKLKSDSSFRKDLQSWEIDDEKAAQAAKEELEEIQRKDTKLRKEYNKTDN